jgi:hypothetical protein
VFIAYVVIAILLAAALGASASLKLRKADRAVAGIHGVVGVPLSWFPYLAACEIAGALGLLVGIALGTHRHRRGDRRHRLHARRHRRARAGQ